MTLGRARARVLFKLYAGETARPARADIPTLRRSPSGATATPDWSTRATDVGRPGIPPAAGLAGGAGGTAAHIAATPIGNRAAIGSARTGGDPRAATTVRGPRIAAATRLQASATSAVELRAITAIVDEATVRVLGSTGGPGTALVVGITDIRAGRTAATPRADDPGGTDAVATLAAISGQTTGLALGRSGGGADASLRVADAEDMAGIQGRADDRVATDAAPVLAAVSLGAGVPVITGGAIGNGVALTGIPIAGLASRAAGRTGAATTVERCPTAVGDAAAELALLSTGGRDTGGGGGRVRALAPLALAFPLAVVLAVTGVARSTPSPSAPHRLHRRHCLAHRHPPLQRARPGHRRVAGPQAD